MTGQRLPGWAYAARDESMGGTTVERPMTEDSSGREARMSVAQPAIDEAARLWQAGDLQKAAEIYLGVLQADPRHPGANHGLGVVAVLSGQCEAALHYFELALDAEPADAGHWLSYIDALDRSGRVREALEVLALARQHGLSGADVDGQESRLLGKAGKSGTSDAVAPAAPPEAAHAKAGAKPGQKETEKLLGLFSSGQLDAAAAMAGDMTRRYPSHWLGWKTLGVVLQHLGRTAEALEPMQRTAAMLPGDAEAHDNLGLVLQRLERLSEAETSYRQALACAPDFARAHGNLGAVLKELGRLPEAEASCRRAIELDPKYARAHNNLGVILQQQGQLDEAALACRRAAELNPDYDEPFINLGAILKAQGHADEAEAMYQRALAVNPDSALALGNLALLEFQAKRLDEAESHARRALQVQPGDADALATLGSVLTGLGRFAEAEGVLGQALQIRPDFAIAHSALGDLLFRQGRMTVAVESYRLAVKFDSDFAPALIKLGVALIETGRMEEAEASCRRALELAPDSGLAYNSLGFVLTNALEHEAAAACFRRAMELAPEFAGAHSNLLFCMSKNPRVDAETLFAEHRRFGELMEARFAEPNRRYQNQQDPDRRLRIGVVSGDLRDHSVAHFIEPVLATLRESAMLQLHAYSTHFIDDFMFRRLRPMFAGWRDVGGLGDDELTAMIIADGMDILIDLSGHTAKNRLPVFARKPAPVQVSWMGYPGTTGMRAMDYYLADRFFLPPERFAWQFTEKLAFLPTTVPFQPNSEAPAVSPLPALQRGHLTFGSFNRLSKVTRDVVALWARLLRELPTARMVVGAVTPDEMAETLAGWFADAGVARERLDFRPRSTMAEYLASHGDVDICLDTFPYSGATTVGHALWMGVPTLTIAGDTPASRGGDWFMHRMGLGDFVADDANGFTALGVRHAGDLARLAAIRAGLRQRFLDSPLGRPELVAAALADALRFMWRRWCADLPAVSFEVDGRGQVDLT